MSSVPETPPNCFCINYQSQKTDSIGTKEKKRKKKKEHALFLLCPFLPLKALSSTTRCVPKTTQSSSFISTQSSCTHTAALQTKQVLICCRYKETKSPTAHRAKPSMDKAAEQCAAARMPSVTTANKGEELRCSPEGNSAATRSSSSRLSTPSPLLAFSHLSCRKMAILQAHFCLR